MWEVPVPKGLSRDGRHRDVLWLRTITVKSALQMWTSNHRITATMNRQPAGDGAGVMLDAPVPMVLPGRAISGHL